MQSIKFIFPILIIAVLLLGCKTETLQKEPNDCINNLAIDTSIYLPLKIGNKWYYNFYHGRYHPFDSTKYNVTWEVKSIKCLDSRVFFMIEEIFIDTPLRGSFIDTFYYGIQGDSILTIERHRLFGSSSIKVEAIVSAKLNETFTAKSDTDGNYLCKLIKKTDSTLSFYDYHDNLQDTDYEKSFKKNVGFIDAYSNWAIGLKLIKYELK